MLVFSTYGRILAKTNSRKELSIQLRSVNVEQVGIPHNCSFSVWCFTFLLKEPLFLSRDGGSFTNKGGKSK